MPNDSDGETHHPTEIIVRRKASMRKGRTEQVEHTARKPTQQRSINRFELILKAAEDLLQENNIEDISFYDVAAKANISPASVNYLFPTMSSLCIELSKRYLRVSTEDVLEAQRVLIKQRNPSWQSWFREMGLRVQAHYNVNRHISEVVLGPALNRESRRAAISGNTEIAQELVAGLNKVFLIPEIPGLLLRFCYAVEIADSIMSRSYILSGYVSDESTEELIRMQIAYLRNFLPETLLLAPAPMEE